MHVNTPNCGNLPTMHVNVPMHVNLPVHVNAPVHVKAPVHVNARRPREYADQMPTAEASLPTNDAGTAEMTPAVKTAGPQNHDVSESSPTLTQSGQTKTGEGGWDPLCRRC